MKRSIYFITLLAFLVRLGLGAASATLLPRIGYETKPQQAGYLFFDAYRRDSQAWELAQSSKPLRRAFDEKYATDQYGGLLWLSAFIYRYIPMEKHQPMLVIGLGALVGALGTMFVFFATKRLSKDSTALFAALIYAFFPESILLGASQMREPFLMTFIAMAFFGLVEYHATQKRIYWGWLALSTAGLYFISPGFVLLTLAVLAGWEYFSDHKKNTPIIPWQILAVGLLIFVLALLALTASWDSLVASKGGGILGIIGGWARGTARWNAHILERSSGIVQVLFQSMPPVLALPFVTIYGVLQPVLPAVILEPGNSFWQVLGTLRALGWYLLLPVIAYAPFATGVFTSGIRRRQWLWLSAMVWGWILVAALRGGGDQWDNPRYRIIVMCWISILAALVISRIQAGPTRWFWRICMVETIILLVFGHWYVWRYLGIGFNLGIRNTIGIAVGLSIFGILADWLWQRFKPTSRL